MWIGQGTDLTRIKDPATGMGATRSGWGVSGVYTTGGAWAVGGPETHLQYTLNWPFLRSHEVAELEEILDPDALLTVLVATAYEVNAIPPNKTNLGTLGAGVHQLSVVPEGESWQFSWAGDGELLVPNHGMVGPGLYSGTGDGDWFTVTRPEPDFDEGDSHEQVYYGDMVLTFGGVRRYEHKKTRGRGNTGMRLKMPDGIQVTEYSAPSAVNYSSVSVGLVETGAWE